MSTDNKNVTVDFDDIDNIFDDKGSKNVQKAALKADDAAAKVVDSAALTGEEGTTVLSGDMNDMLTGEEGTTVLSNEEMGLDLNTPNEFVPQGGFQPVSGPIPTAPQGGFQPQNGPIPNAAPQQNNPVPPVAPQGGFQPQNGPIPNAPQQNKPVPPVPPQGGFKPQNGPIPQQIPNFQPRPAGVEPNKNAASAQGMPQAPNMQTPNGAPQAPNMQTPNGAPQAPNMQAPNGMPAVKPGVLAGPAPNMPQMNGPMPGAIPPDGMSKKAKKVKTPKDKSQNSGEGKGMKVFGLVSMFIAIAGIIAAGVLLALNLFFSDYTKNYKDSAKKGIQSEISVITSDGSDQEDEDDVDDDSDETDDADDDSADEE